MRKEHRRGDGIRYARVSLGTLSALGMSSFAAIICISASFEDIHRGLRVASQICAR